MHSERLNRITINDCSVWRPALHPQHAMRVTDVLELLVAGAGLDEILDHPYLQREDILAAIAYAPYQTDHDRSIS